MITDKCKDLLKSTVFLRLIKINSGKLKKINKGKNMNQIEAAKPKKITRKEKSE